GTVANAGTIALPTDNVTAAVDGNNFAVTFDGTGTPAATSVVRVFAPTFQAGDRSIPVPAVAGVPLVSWNTEADGTGDRFTRSTVLTGDVTVHALRTGVILDLTGATTVTAGTPLSVQVAAASEGIIADATGNVDFSSSNPTDTFAGAALLAT